MTINSLPAVEWGILSGSDHERNAPGLAPRRPLRMIGRNGTRQRAGRFDLRILESEIMSVTMTPLTPAVGAEVANVDLRTLDDAAFVEIERVWHRHSVLLFRDQQLSDDDLLAFS